MSALALPPAPDSRDAFAPDRPRFLFARERDRIIPVEVAQVIRFVAEGDYSRVHASGRVLLLSNSLGELERCLDPALFLRVHRSHLISLAAVLEIRPFGDRRLLFVLRDGTEVLSSRSGARRLRAYMR